MNADELVPVYYPYDNIEAHAVKQMLEDDRIPCHIEGEHQASWAGGGSIVNASRRSMRILVRTANAERAKTLITAGIWPTAGAPSGVTFTD